MGRNSGGTKPGPGDLGEGDSGYRGSITNIQSLVHMVVNCFQISNFVLWQTASTYRKFAITGCELLSN